MFVCCWHDRRTKPVSRKVVLEMRMTRDRTNKNTSRSSPLTLLKDCLQGEDWHEYQYGWDGSYNPSLNVFVTTIRVPS